jgi:hypothetical protein
MTATLSALLAVTVLTTGTVATTSASAAPAKGDPIVIYTVASPDFFGGVGAGLKAAAKAINDKGGVKDPAGGPNRPFKVVVCDDAGGANASAKCGRDAVDAGALAVVGSQSAYGAQYEPIIFEAGIPFVAGGAYDTPALTNDLSFPINNSVVEMSGGFQFLGSSIGLKKSWSIIPDLPSADAIKPVVDAANDAAGVDQVGESKISSGTTSTPDYTPYAAAAADSGAQFIWMNIGPGGVGMMKALATQGVDFHETGVLAAANVVSLADLKPLGKFKDGVYFVGTAFPATYNANKGVRQYNKEMDALGDTKSPRVEASMMAWTGLHVIANLVPSMTEITPAALVTAMKAAGPIQYGPLAPFDWSKKAYSEGLLAALRIFTNYMLPMRVVGEKLLPISRDFVPNNAKFKVTKAGQLKSTG